MVKPDLSDAIAYFRVSTSKQFEEYHSAESYLYRFKAYGFEPNQIYSDVDSGANNQRKGYQLVLAQIRAGKKRVFVPEFTRFTRSPGGWEEAIKDFQQAGATLVTLDGLNVGFTTPEELYMGRQLVISAAYEREKNQFRALKGYEFARLQGRAIRAVFGYIKDGDRLAPNLNLYKDTESTIWEIAEEVVRTFIACHGNLSETVRLMSRKYGTRKGRKINFADFPHDHSALRDWFTNPALRGNLEYFRVRRPQRSKFYRDRSYAKPQIVYGTHEPLISAVQWRDIERLLARGKELKKSPDTLRNPLQGLLFCAGCQGPMKCNRSKSGSKYFYYLVCRNAYPNDAHKRIQQEMGEAPSCDRRSSYGAVLEHAESAVISALCERAEVIARIGAATVEAQETPEITKLRQQIYEYESLAFRDSDLLPVLEKKRSQLARLVEENQSETGDRHESQLRLVQYASNPDFWLEANPPQRHHLYREFVQAVVLDEGKISVKLKI